MKFDPKIHHRRSIRLKGYDYSSPGAYFITVVAYGRESLFGEIQDGEMRLSRFGQIVRRAWDDLPPHYPHVELGTFCIMPNHIHGIIILTDGNGRGGSRMAAKTWQDYPLDGSGRLANGHQTRPYGKHHALPEIVRALKSFSAKRINAQRGTEGLPVWQRNYYERIIRNDEEFNRIHRYIESNPLRWAEDEENPGGGP